MIITAVSLVLPGHFHLWLHGYCRHHKEAAGQTYLYDVCSRNGYLFPGCYASYTYSFLEDIGNFTGIQMPQAYKGVVFAYLGSGGSMSILYCTVL